MKILVVGSGGREHAIIWKLKKDDGSLDIYCCPGNGGIEKIANCVDIAATDIHKIADFAENGEFDLVVVAPDDPLAMGLVDILTERGIKAFGPTAAAAQIEASKVFAKNLMKKYNIPTAAYEVFSDYDDAIKYIQSAKFPLVVKADGLALGKGVIICNDLPEAVSALDEIMIKSKFGQAGNSVVIEEFISGPEVSVLAFCDGKTIIPMISAQDHKRIFDDDKGENTGGMGTFAPSPKYTNEIAKYCEENIFIPTINAMNAENRKFKGILYFGLMLTESGVKVLEYNARFGDPETQVILPLLKTSLLDIFTAVIDSKLNEINIEWEHDSCVCVILASGGYPKAYKKGDEIFGLSDDMLIFHAGTKAEKERFLTNGGRVLGVTAKGKNIADAREKAYSDVYKIHFDGMQFRRDIGIK